MKRKNNLLVVTIAGIFVALVAAFFVVNAFKATTFAANSSSSVTFPRTGPFQVGKTGYDLVDQGRPEIFVNNAQAKREILATVYYPAQPKANTQPAPFMEGKVLETFSQVYGVPASFITTALHSNAYTNAPLADEQKMYPVVIFSPGWGANPLLYAPTLEDLASHGYVVVALWHTYSCDFTVFPDGRVVYANKAGSDPDHYPDEQNQQTQIRERVGGVWAADARFMLDQLTLFNQSDPRFAHHLDLKRVGMFGHSFGGTVALELRGLDGRFTAFADVDGGLSFGQSDLKTQYDKPTFFLFSDDPRLTDEELKQQGLTRQQYEDALRQYHAQEQKYYENSSPGYLLRLKNSAHMTYAATEALIAPLLGGKLTAQEVGTINGARAVHIYDAYLTAFFDEHLKDQPEPLLRGFSPWHNDVAFEAHR